MLTKSTKRVKMGCKHKYQVRIGYEEAESFAGDMYQLAVTEVYECLDCKKIVKV
jgi:hypothetical protein